MKGKKNASTGHIDINPEVLAELFPSPDSITLHSFSDDDLAAIGRILAYGIAVGAMVTFYGSGDERIMCLSLRAGQRRRALLLGGDDADASFLGSLASGLQRAYLAQLQLANATELDEQATKKKSKGK